MNIYIKATSAISAQNTFLDSETLDHLSPLAGDRVKVEHPAYREHIAPRLLRRMSAVVRMGVACANALIEENYTPEAILIGTSLGCLTDTEKFLNQLVAEKESLLNPTAFIQSTHNTVSGQIAMLNACNSHNLTFSHGRYSFDQALLEAVMLLNEPNYKDILVGAVDECTDLTHELINNELVSGKKKIKTGEGASFFRLSSTKSENELAKITDFSILNKNAENNVDTFLKANKLTLKDIDVVITGDTNSPELATYTGQMIDHRELCGEYDTDVAFALHLAANIISEQRFPTYLKNETTKEINHALVINESKGKALSLMLIEPAL